MGRVVAKLFVAQGLRSPTPLPADDLAPFAERIAARIAASPLR